MKKTLTFLGASLIISIWILGMIKTTVLGARTAQHEAPVPEGYRVDYVSKEIYPGETLWEISLEIVTDNEMPWSIQDEVDAIVEINGLQSANKITAGHHILCPVLVRAEGR